MAHKDGCLFFSGSPCDCGEPCPACRAALEFERKVLEWDEAFYTGLNDVMNIVEERRQIRAQHTPGCANASGEGAGT